MLEAQEEWPEEQWSAWQEEETEELWQPPDDSPLDEQTVQTVLAVYPAVRDALKRDVLSRGFVPPGSKGKGKEKGKMNKGKGKGQKGKSWGKPNMSFNTSTSGSSKLQQLISRTRCAKRGIIGHWARDCRSGGGSGANSGGKPALPGSPSTYANYFIAESPGANPHQSFGIFIGLTTSPEQGVLDTGAQGAVLGEAALSRLSKAMAEHGIKPIELELTEADTETKGVGGKATVIKKVSLPIGISKTSGLLTALV
eukprot:4691918-Amphidinium_carterae.2